MPVIKVTSGMRHEDISKNEITWCITLGYYNIEILFSSEKYSKGGVMEGVVHSSDGNPNVLNANRNDDESWVNANYDNPDNQWNDNGAFAFLATQFISKSRHMSAFSFLYLFVL